MGVFDFFRSVGKRLRGRSGRFLPGSIRETKVDKRLLAPELGKSLVSPKVVSGMGLGGDLEDDFLYFGKWYDKFTSTNVAAVRYLEDYQQMFVRFLNGTVYGYEPVTLEMARSLFSAGSKGGWVWDNLRVRGTKYGHQVSYYLDVGQSSRIPMYRLEGGARERAHDAQALAEGGKYTGYFEGVVPDAEDTGYYPTWREPVSAPAPILGQSTSPAAKLWTAKINGIKYTMHANTKSEARAELKKKIGVIPSGSSIERA